MNEFWFRPLPKPTCGCGARATHEVMNVHNASQGKFCWECAKRFVREHLQAIRRDARKCATEQEDRP